MKVHTTEFKDTVKLYGKELYSKISYTLNGENIVLGNEELNMVSPHYEADILKSVMKQLDIDSSVEIPVGTIVNYQFGVKVRDDNVTEELNYDFVNYGNYIVDKVEIQEDKKSYLITCYDKMLYSMVDYELPNISYPINIKDYIYAICNKLGLGFQNLNDTFPNSTRQIQAELYAGLGYKFRDVLDELAQVTGSTICINEQTDNLEIRYITETNDIIDAEYLKDNNVNFGKKYGPINSIVLSRSAESDNVYINDEQSIAENGLCEIKIRDNQIMNFNDRSDYLPDLLAALGGLQYYLNDFASTGIMYYNMCDRYTINTDDKNYSCVMLNDDANVTQGLEEFINTPMPEKTETDYSKADKTDIRINQTYLIVDKQNQIIESVVTNVTEQNNKISKITQTVDEINSKISDIADITISGESSFATFDLDGINQSEPIMIKVHSTGENICYLYPRDNLYPEDTLYAKNRTIRFYNKTTGETFDYELPDDLLYFDNSTYDEFYLDYDSQTCQIIKRCAFNADGTVRKLDTEVVTDYPYPHIQLSDGDYTISILSYQYGYIFTRLMSQNIYTSQFATKAELSSSITQTKESIDLSVNQKLSGYSTTSQMNAAINLKANEITSSVSSIYATKNELTTAKSEIKQTTDSISSTVSTKVGNNEIISKINQSPESITIDASKVNIRGTIQAINNDTSTTINGNKITTGSVDATKVASDVITTNNFSAQDINADNIKTGTLNANNINVTNINGSNVNRGTISDSSINIYNGVGFLKMIKSDSNHPYVSALNVASYADNPSANGPGISFRSSKNRSGVGSQIGYISYGSNGGAIYYSSGNMNITSAANVHLKGATATRLQNNLYVTSDALRWGSNSSTTAQIVSGGTSIYLKPKSGGYAYVGEQANTNKIATSISGPSSKNVKTNLKEINLDKIYNDFKIINVYDYDYKYSNLGDENYGFIIDEIENTDDLSKYFKNYETKKEIIDGELFPANKNSKNTINVKEWHRDSYIKGMFVVMKSMQEEIEKLKKEMEELKNGKN